MKQCIWPWLDGCCKKQKAAVVVMVVVVVVMTGRDGVSRWDMAVEKDLLSNFSISNISKKTILLSSPVFYPAIPVLSLSLSLWGSVPLFFVFSSEFCPSEAPTM